MKSEVAASILGSVDGLVEQIVALHEKIASVERQNQILGADIRLLAEKLTMTEALLSFESKLSNASFQFHNEILSSDESVKSEFGFYELEAATSPMPFRWTGPENRFFFRFFVNRSKELSFRVNFCSVSPLVAMETLRYSTDGVSWHAPDLKADHVTGVIPVSPEPGTTLAFKYLRDAAQESEKDKRRLGMAFTKLVVHGE